MKNKKGFFGEIFFNLDFLFLRKKLLKFIFLNNFEEKLRDILYYHQPKPSIDLCILEISEKLKKILDSKKINGLKIEKEKKNNFLNYDFKKYLKGKKNKNDFCFLISFQDNIKKSIFEIEFENKKKLLNSKKKLKKFPICYFLNNNLSISFIKIWKSNNYMINFEGSTTNGSSGGPIFNNKGHIVGINFGYYIFGDDEDLKKNKKKNIRKNKNENDFFNNKTILESINFMEIEENQFKNKNSKNFKNKYFSSSKNKNDDNLNNLINYDISLENKNNDNIGIGLNLGISIFHPVIRIFFGFNSFEKYKNKIFKKKGKKLSEITKKIINSSSYKKNNKEHKKNQKNVITKKISLENNFFEEKNINENNNLIDFNKRVEINKRKNLYMLLEG